MSLSPPSPVTSNVPLGKSTSIDQQICMFLGIFAFLGFVLAQCVSALELDDTFHSGSDNIYYHLFSTYDQWHLIFLASTCVFFFVWLRKNPSAASRPVILTKKIAIMVALAVCVAASLGTHFVFLNYPFAMDEYYSDFQAAIFAQGKVFSTIPAELTPLASAASPLLVNYNPSAQTWTSNYLPVYALLRTPFWMAGCSWLVNPLLAGLTIFAMAGVIKRMWPEDPGLRWIGVILLGTNVQFLITGMTAYAMSAHLLANLVWLWLYLDPSPKKQLLAPLLGILAIGLHQPNVHLIFAFPFCVKLLLEKRWKMAAWYGLIYAAGLFLWLQFGAYKAVPSPTTNPQETSTFAGYILKTFFSRLPSSTQFLDLTIGWSKIFAWAPFALIFFFGLALLQWRKLTANHFCLLVSIFLASAVSLLFPLNQGHGWGNRYLFPYLGNLTLIAVAGFHNWPQRQRAMKIVYPSSVLCILIILPARAWECHREVRPFATASQFLHSLPQNILAVDTNTIWYGQDLVRNDPGLTNRPTLIFMRCYTEEVKDFCEAHPTSGRIGYHQLKPCGIKPRQVRPIPPVQTR